jgi:hypothetical protein
MTRPAPESSSSQRARILRLLIEARGGWVPSPAIAECAQQYNARLFELRRLNFRIENRVAEQNGTRLSSFRLVSSPAQAISPSTSPAAERDEDDPQMIPPNVKSDPREQLQLFSPKEDLR